MFLDNRMLLYENCSRVHQQTFISRLLFITDIRPGFFVQADTFML